MDDGYLPRPLLSMQSKPLFVQSGYFSATAGLGHEHAATLPGD